MLSNDLGKQGGKECTQSAEHSSQERVGSATKHYVIAESHLT